MLDVSVLSPKEVIFEGEANSIILPGEQGVFEVQPFHKRILSRLISGVLFVDGQSFSVQRGIVKVNQNKVTIIIEEGF
jgi:F-type H+-transporting ATPase subunit epsilon